MLLLKKYSIRCSEIKFWILFLFIIVFSFESQAQNIHVNYANGGDSIYSLNDVDKITFDLNVMNLHFEDGNIYSWHTSTIENFNYNNDQLNVSEIITELNKWELSIYPNPTNDVLNLQYNLLKDDIIEVVLYSSGGEIFMIRNLGKQTKGVHFETFDISNTPSGIIICSVVGQLGAVNKKVNKF